MRDGYRAGMVEEKMKGRRREAGREEGGKKVCKGMEGLGKGNKKGRGG